MVQRDWISLKGWTLSLSARKLDAFLKSTLKFECLSLQVKLTNINCKSFSIIPGNWICWLIGVNIDPCVLFRETYFVGNFSNSEWERSMNLFPSFQPFNPDPKVKTVTSTEKIIALVTARNPRFSYWNLILILVVSDDI